MRQDACALKDNAEELVQLVRDRDIPNWLALAVTFRGEALAMLGQVKEGLGQVKEGIAQIREGHAIQDAMGVQCYLTVGLAAGRGRKLRGRHPAQGLATLDDALRLVEETDERHWEAELYRVQAELLLSQGRGADSEASLQKAIEGSPPPERQVVGAAGDDRPGAPVAGAGQGGRGPPDAGRDLWLVHGGFRHA